MKLFCKAAVLALALAVPGLTLQAQITVTGIANKNYTSYANSATFTVTIQSNYTGVARLNGMPVPVGVAVTVNQSDYYELLVLATNITTLAAVTNLTQFVVYPTERSSTERGLPPIQLYPPIPSAQAEFAGAQLRLLIPDTYPAGMEVPVVIWVVDASNRAVRVNGQVAISGNTNTIAIKRGVGSGFLQSVGSAGPVEYTFQIGGVQTNKTVTYETGTVWTNISGTLSNNIVWGENARIAITNQLHLTNGATLTIGAGAIIRISSVVSITNSGTITINGTADRPTVFAPVTRAQPWGGIVQHTNSTSLTGTGVIFTGAGGSTGYWFGGHGHDPSFSGIDSHRAEQALISMAGVNNNLTLTDSAAIYLPGQFGHTLGGSSRTYRITLTRFLMQGTTTGGEYTDALFNVNDSAFIECPDVSTNFVDGDNDGLYITSAPLGPHGFTNTLFGWMKDDGIDSGGSGAGVLNYQNCWFEGIAHEANSLSGTESASPHADKVVTHTGGVFINCGQALEAGYGAPTGRVERCLVINCMTGARYGDNYDWSYYGRMTASNSVFLNNHRDIWGINFDDWAYRTASMDIRSNLLTKADPYHPNNALWNPATDGGRLAVWMASPPEAVVGIGLGIWTNAAAMSALFNGVPVRLSTFTTNLVTVQYELVNAEGSLATGSLTFTPGEMVKKIYPAGFDLTTNSTVDVQLTGATGGEITGLTNATFTGAVAKPTVQLNVATNQFSAWRLAEGPFVSLSGPSALPVSLDYQLADTNGVVETGTLVFAPNETRKQLFAAAISPFDFARLTLTLNNPTNATLTGTTAVTYTYTVVPQIMSLGVTGSQNLDSIAAGVPVNLTAPAASGVSVQFQVTGNRGGATNGTLAFAAGGLSARLLTPTVDPAQNDFIKVTLANATKAAFSGPTTVYYVRVTPTPAATNTMLVARGATTIWRYRDLASDPGADWKLASLDDTGAQWKSGGAQLGFGESDQTTAISSNRQTTTYFRYLFNVADPNAYASLNLWLLRDDGGVVHLNGREVFRSPNLPALPTNITYSTFTLSGQNGENTIDTATVNATNLIAGTNLVAVEIHQSDATSSDLSFDFELVAVGKPPSVAQPVYQGMLAGQYTLAWGDPAFKLLEATNLLGPWSTNSASGTFTTLPTNNESYYRLVKP